MSTFFRPRRERRKTRGGALLAVLWLSAGLAGVALSVSSDVRSETDRVSTSSEGLRASYLASRRLHGRAILWVSGAPHGPKFPSGEVASASGPPTRGASRCASRRRRASGSVPETSSSILIEPPPDDLYRVVLAVSGDPAAREIMTVSSIGDHIPVSAFTAADSI